MIIVNADDWGRTITETDVALALFARGRITSVSAMVFMADSERAAAIARQQQVHAGLHLNFSETFTAPPADARLCADHARIVRFLKRHKYAQLMFNPFLHAAFRRVAWAQGEEYLRLYGKPPTHYDGHQHMHLCTNMLVAAPVPRGCRMRRGFSFAAGQKGVVNRAYRAVVARWLRSRYRATDFFFALSQNLAPDRFARVCEFARRASVELMTHPVVPDEQSYLNSEAYAEALRPLARGSYLDL